MNELSSLPTTEKLTTKTNPLSYFYVFDDSVTNYQFDSINSTFQNFYFESATHHPLNYTLTQNKDTPVNYVFTKDDLAPLTFTSEGTSSSPTWEVSTTPLQNYELNLAGNLYHNTKHSVPENPHMVGVYRVIPDPEENPNVVISPEDDRTPKADIGRPD